MARRRIALVTTVLGLVGMTGAFAVAPSASAKRPKCSAQPIPNQAGAFVVTCTTNRP
jgi:hypothetical protein